VTSRTTSTSRSARRETVDLTVTSLAPGGSGVAHLDRDGERRAVFVPQTAPGDRVRAEVDLTERPARGHVLEVLSAGPDRVTPPCPWASACGACDWMHLAPEAQTRTHVEHLRAALPAPWREFPVDVHAAPAALGYRTRARIHVRCGRSGRATVGMHGARTHDPVHVDSCAVLDPALEDARRSLAAYFEGCTGRGEVHLGLGARRLPVIDVVWSGRLLDACFARLEGAVKAGALEGASVTVEHARQPARIGDPTPWMNGPDGSPLQLAPGGFGQANAAVNAALADHVVRAVRALRPGKAVELYAGAGNLSVVLAAATEDLVCVEASREACDAARANLARRGLRARVVEADAETYAWKPSTSLVVLDPPRTGARAAVERIAGSRVAHVVYVSCDAQTLGRDLATLQQGYELRSLAAFEMFPQTSHVEIVAVLARRRP
jgi:23S rRNA (uracil1939-C5)-methyltransferase